MTSADLLVRQYYLFKIHLPIFLLIRFTINSWNSSRSSPFRGSKYRDGNVDNWNQGNEFLTFLLNCIVITPFQVVDLLAPYQKGGKIGLFGGTGVGKTVLSWNSLIILRRAMVCSLFNFLTTIFK